MANKEEIITNEIRVEEVNRDVLQVKYRGPCSENSYKAVAMLGMATMMAAGVPEDRQEKTFAEISKAIFSVGLRDPEADTKELMTGDVDEDKERMKAEVQKIYDFVESFGYAGNQKYDAAMRVADALYPENAESKPMVLLFEDMDGEIAASCRGNESFTHGKAIAWMLAGAIRLADIPEAQKQDVFSRLSDVLMGHTEAPSPDPEGFVTKVKILENETTRRIEWAGEDGVTREDAADMLFQGMLSMRDVPDEARERIEEDVNHMIAECVPPKTLH